MDEEDNAIESMSDRKFNDEEFDIAHKIKAAISDCKNMNEKMRMVIDDNNALYGRLAEAEKYAIKISLKVDDINDYFISW